MLLSRVKIHRFQRIKYIDVKCAYKTIKYNKVSGGRNSIEVACDFGKDGCDHNN